MHNKARKKSKFVLIIGCLLSALMLGTVATANQTSDLVSVLNSQKFVVNSSYISPLVELFGDVSVGKKVFVASNTIVRADPDTRICLGNETNLQDNIHFLSARSTPAPRAECGTRSSSTGERTSIAHQANIKNSKIGNFTFVGFRARLNNVVLEDGAFVLHGATLELGQSLLA